MRQIPNEPVPKELSKDFALKEISIESEGVEFKFKWKPLTWYEEERLINSCMSIDSTTRKITLDTAELNIKMLLNCLKDAPFAVSPDNIKMLKTDVKSKLLEEITPARLTENVEKKLSGP